MLRKKKVTNVSLCQRYTTLVRHFTTNTFTPARLCNYPINQSSSSITVTQREKTPFDLSNLVTGAWVFQTPLISVDFHTHQSLVHPERQKHPLSSSSVERKCFVDKRGQSRMARLVRPDRKATVTHIPALRQWWAEELFSMHNMLDMREISYNRRRSQESEAIVWNPVWTSGVVSDLHVVGDNCDWSAR